MAPDRDDPEDSAEYRCCGTCYHWRIVPQGRPNYGCTAGGIIERTPRSHRCHLMPSMYVEYWRVDGLKLKDRDW